MANQESEVHFTELVQSAKLDGTDDDPEVGVLFRKHVPEILTGAVQIASIARDKGAYLMVAVRSDDRRVNPVSACVRA